MAKIIITDLTEIELATLNDIVARKNLEGPEDGEKVTVDNFLTVSFQGAIDSWVAEYKFEQVKNLQSIGEKFIELSPDKQAQILEILG